MLNYLKGDFYRLFLKKGLYVYFAIVIGCMLAGVYIGSGSINAYTLRLSADFAFTIFGTFASAYLFNAIYDDDLTAKTLPSIVGFGKRRETIVLSKLILFVVFSVVVFFIAVALFCLFIMVLGIQISSDNFQAIVQTATLNMLKGIAVGTVASVVAYGLQKATPAIVIFILASTSFFTPLITMLLDKLNISDLSQYLIDPILGELSQAVNVGTVLPYILYVSLFTVLAIVAFKLRDLEF